MKNKIKADKDFIYKVLNNAALIILTLNKEGNVTFINQTGCDALKLPEDKIINKNWFDHFIPNSSRDEIKLVFQSLMNGKETEFGYFENQIVNSKNEEILIGWHNNLIRDDNGNIEGIISSGNDITDKKQTKIELEESERKYRALVENMHEGISIVDLNEIVVFCNPAFDKIFGFEAGGMIGKDLKNYILEDDLHLIFNETAKRKEDKTSQYKVKIKWKDKTKRILNVSSVPWKNSNNEIIGTIGMVIDITAQEFATNRLQNKVKIEQSIINISSQFISSENFETKLDSTLQELKNIIEAERYGILAIQNDKLKLINEQYNENVEAIGDDFEEISYLDFQYGLSMLDSFDFIFFDNVNKLPDEAVSEKEIFSKYKIFNFLGIPFYVESKLAGLLTISNIYEVDEWTIEDLSIFRTVTEIIGHAFSRKKAEDKVRQLNLDLITKNKEMEKVVYVTSHDIRSPVVNILGFSNEMIKALNKLYDRIFDEANSIRNKDDIEFLIKKDIPQILNFIKVSGEKIDRLLLALLKLSRLGRTVINKTNVNINQLVKTVINNYEYIIEQENITIVVGDLPGCYTDEVAINQVFSNLIDNSIKYRSKERDTIIKITGQENNGKITYCIEDNGIGILESEIDKIFDVFYRINPENGKGEGIGLSLIKKIMERLDGNISLGSEEGKGTKFYISLEKQKKQNSLI